MEAIIKINMFSMYSTVYLKGTDKENDYHELLLSEIARFLMQYEDLKAIHIFGNDQYIKGVVNDIKKQELKKYNRNKIDIIINE